MSPEQREKRLTELKARIDTVHEILLHAIRKLDEAAIDKAMDQQHQLMQEYTALRKLASPQPTDSP